MTDDSVQFHDRSGESVRLDRLMPGLNIPQDEHDDRLTQRGLVQLEVV